MADDASQSLWSRDYFLIDIDLAPTGGAVSQSLWSRDYFLIAADEVQDAAH